MKTLIAYASKTGTTERCARELAAQLNGADVFDLRSGSPDLSGYELVIIGGGIRAGMLDKPAKKYIKINTELLKTKKVALFVCSADAERADEFLKANVPAEVLTAAVCAESFGGEMDINKQKGLFKFFLKKMLAASEKKGNPLPRVLPERIESFAEKLKRLG